MIADLDGAGGIKANYTRTPAGKMLSMYNIQSSPPYTYRDTYYVFTDALGSTVMLFGKNSGFAKSYSYEEFGKYTSAAGGTDTRFTFTGAPYFSAPGLYQMGARFYNPAIGRFISRDSYKGNIYRPWTQNLYTYCNNNPVNYVDPTGHLISPPQEVGENAVKAAKTIAKFFTGDPNNDFDGAMLMLGPIGEIGIVGRNTGKVVVVIGENMTRVKAYAENIGATIYNGMPGFVKGMEKEALEHNRAWIQEQIDKGAKIIDIGPDFKRRKTDLPSPGYEMEREMTKNYENIEKVFIREGETGGVPGLDPE